MRGQHIFNFQSESFAEAALQSEQVRIIGMIAILAALVIVSIVRIAGPIEQAPEVGWILLALHGGYLVYECIFLRVVAHRLASVRDLPAYVWRTNAVAESLLPLLAMTNGILFTNLDPYVVLIMPALPFILVLMTMSTLRIDPLQSALGGTVSTIGYTALTVFVFVRYPYAEFNAGQLHWSIFVFMVLMLALGTLVATFVSWQVRHHVIGALFEAQVRREKEQMQADLAVAQSIQRHLLPSRLPNVPGYDVAARSVPASQTGGDYYDWQPLGDGRIVISLADVTGHGVGPALVTAACRAYVRAILQHETAPKIVLDRVNRLLARDVPGGRFVTFAMLEIDPQHHRGVFLAAGHGPSFFVSGDNGDVKSVGAQGLPLAVLAEHVSDNPIEFEFRPGDVVAIFSDGFFEWADGGGRQFGEQRLLSVVRENRHVAAASIVARMDQAVRTFANGRPQPDDMTAVVVKRHAA